MENTQRAKAFEGVSTGCQGHVELEMSTGYQNGDSEQSWHTVWGSERKRWLKDSPARSESL